MMTNKVDKMPTLFIGHGSPMNAIEDNEYTRNWEEIARKIPKPKAILVISAHWYTKDTRIMNEEDPRMIYDMYGFPEELYKVTYKSKGAPALAMLTKKLIDKDVKVDSSWGYDHGTWSILNKMYPKGDVPVYQLSVDSTASAESHFQIGKDIRILREKGVLILGSGNVVHNLSEISWEMEDGYPWAVEFDNYIKDKILKKEYQDVIHFERAGKCVESAFTIPDHFYPLLYVLGASTEDDRVEIWNDSCVLGSLSMTSYLFE